MRRRRRLTVVGRVVMVALVVIAAAAMLVEEWPRAACSLLMLITILLAEIGVELAAIRARMMAEPQVRVTVVDPGATADQAETWLRNDRLGPGRG